MSSFKIEDLHHTLIVSCQAARGAALDDPRAMAFMAAAAAAGGAGGIRANGPQHIAAIKATVSLPVIGLLKRHVEGFPVYITSTFDDAERLAEVGSDLIAVDATLRPRPGGASITDLIRYIRQDLAIPVVADVDCVEAAISARDAGADFVATTLAGYTSEIRAAPDVGPDVGLVRELATTLGCPVIAEGRYRSPRQALAALQVGAFAVVVGRSITDPAELTKSFVEFISTKELGRPVSRSEP
jgi:N-acylglucosamine-6-phosphate 2-epimerase